MLKKRFFGIITVLTIAMLIFNLTGCPNPSNGGNGEPHTHFFSEAWSYNETQHWKECSCGERANVASHTFVGDICTICGYNKSTGSGPKTLIITDITEALMAQAGGGTISLFPAGTSLDNVMADFEANNSGIGSIQYAVAGNDFNHMDPPVPVGSTYNFTVPLYNFDATPWTGSGTFDIYLAVIGAEKWSLYKIANKSIISGITYVSASENVIVANEDIPGIRGTITLTNIPSSPALKNIWVQVEGSPQGGSGLWWHCGRNPENRLNPILNIVDFSSGTTNLPWSIHVDHFDKDSGSGDFFPADLQFRVFVSFDDDDGGPPSGHAMGSDYAPYDVFIPELKSFNSLEDAMTAVIDLGTVSLTTPPRGYIQLDNFDTEKQSEGSSWFVFGLFPTDTPASTVLADAKAHRNQTPPSAVVAYTGGDINDFLLPPLPGLGSIIIFKLISASDHQSVWYGSGEYDAWFLLYNGTVWNGYKMQWNIDVQINYIYGISTENFSKEITDQL